MNLADQIRIAITLLMSKEDDGTGRNAKIVGITNAILILLQKNGIITGTELDELFISSQEVIVLGKVKYDPNKMEKEPSEKSSKKASIKKLKTKDVSQPDQSKNREDGE